MGTLLGNKEGAPLPGTLRENLKVIYQEKLKNVLSAGISLHRGPGGETGGESLAGTF